MDLNPSVAPIIPFQFAIAFNHVVPVPICLIISASDELGLRVSDQRATKQALLSVLMNRDLPLLHVVWGFYQKPVCSFAVTTGGR